MKHDRSKWEIRCAFNGFCKRVLRNEMLNAKKAIQSRRKQEVLFSELTPQELNQLSYSEDFFEKDDDFCVDGKRMTIELLNQAIKTLTEELRETILLYYFFDLTDVAISKLHHKPKSTVQYHRSKALLKLKEYLEANAHDWDD